MSKLFFLSLLCLLFHNLCFAQKARIEKVVSHYYPNDSTKITDSLLIAFNHYDEKGNLFKVEETKYFRGMKSEKALAYFRGKENLLASYINGKLDCKIDYDSLGTVIREFSLIDHGKDSLIFRYYPTYKNGQLSSRKMIKKSKNFETTTIEEYTYQKYADSLVITTIMKGSSFKFIQKKCFDKNKQLLYTQHNLQSPYKESNSFWQMRYHLDNTGKVIEIVETQNNQIISTEKIYYWAEKRVKSHRTTPKMTVITTFE
jgi:hypothetical protein